MKGLSGLRILALALLTALAAPVVAQTVAENVVSEAAATIAAPDYVAWEAVATRAEDAIQTERASDAALEQLRAELVKWRTTFLEAQDQNADRIATLRDQIDALGPVPAEGETEARELADRRAQLNAQLAELMAPVLKAQEAYRRADGLVGEIDRIFRERQASALLQLGPSPLNPLHWPAAISALSGTLAGVLEETTAAWASPTSTARLRQDIPLVLFYTLVALVLLVRGRRWMERAVLWVDSKVTRAANVIGSLISLGQVLLPLVGLVALVQAVEATGLLGLRGRQIAEMIPIAGLAFFAARWLGGRLFPRPGDRAPVVDLPPERNAEARWLSSTLGGMIAVQGLASGIADLDGYSDAASAVIEFPIIVIAGILLLRIARLLRLSLRLHDSSLPERPFRNRLVNLVAQAATLAALAGPVLAAIGYLQAATFITFPAIETLALLGLLTLLQRFVTDVYGLVTGAPDKAAEALIPVLLGFVMWLLALPVVALIWGARTSDITELWARFTAGVSVGDTRISPAVFLTLILVFAAGYGATRLLQAALRSSVLPRTRIDPGGQNAIASGVGYVGIFLSALIAINAAGINLSSLAIVAGALSVGIGFGLQNIVSNFVSGVILLIERPISEGDWVEVGSNMGIVKAISVRSTRIETFDRTDVIIPNADFISGTVTNWTKGNLTGRAIIPVGVAYGTDTRKVERILKEIAMEHPLVAMTPEPGVDFLGFGADSLDFRIRAILKDVNFIMSVKTEINHRIAERFAEEGIEIPFAQRDIWLRNPETLAGLCGGAEPAPAASPPPRKSEATPELPRPDTRAPEDWSDPDD